MGKNFIYLDHNATTPIDPDSIESMSRIMKEEFGNPSCSYDLGIRAKSAVEESRRQVAALLGCGPEEVVFTSGGSESNNMVLKGIVDFRNPAGCHIITSAVEHPAILNPALFLMELGAEVTFLQVDGSGRVNPEEVRKAIRSATRLITVMLANNETGTLQPIQEISAIAREHEIPLHTDAAQAVGKIPVDVHGLGLDFLSVAGHKLYGPKGIGALFIRKGQRLTPLIHGAAQEGGSRAGTENVIFAVGLGVACEVAKERIQDDRIKMKEMRDRLETLLFAGVDGLVLNGHSQERLPNTLNISVPGLPGSEILEGIPGLCASTGAACHEKSVHLSHVLSAMGVPPEIGMGALRLTVGRSNTMEQIETAAEWIVSRVKEMRNDTGTPGH
ncbi:MAG: cysteine desulfurase family protein [Desulfobacterales bacterium]|nr:cysteine desulfurase family protein [Desulfobacterales bacterium]